jgi:phage anti-repressor protein
MNKIVAFIFILSCISVESRAQKVKYKDLIELLKVKQYEKAEPFLRRYLKENDDNPNAFLYMGITLQEKAQANDVLKHTDILIARCDSSVMFFDKAYNMITEKELKRNDEYYEMYSRRDLRTGEFGIKISDVRLDLETRVKSLKERKEKVKELKKYFVQAESQYTKLNSNYKSIESKYGPERSFYLRADETLVGKLKGLEVVFDSVITSFNNYKSVSKQLGKTGYNQQLNLQEIIDMKRDGSSPSDFTNDDLKIWDYKRWSKSTVETIEKVIYPLKDRLISYDIALNKLSDKIKKDSVSVINEVTQLEDNLLYSQLLKYDADPLPIAVFDVKKAEMKYQSNVISHKPIKDTSNVKLRLTYLTEELKGIRHLDSIAGILAKRDLSTESDNYSHFITKSYGTKSVLASLISTTLDYAHREELKKQIEWEATMQATKWAVNGTDSIPLFFEKSRDLNHKPLVIVEEKYTVGLVYKDSLATGYLYSITPTRVPDVKATFSVDQSSFNKRNLPIIKCLSTSDAAGQVFYSVIYSEGKVEDKFPATVTKVYRSDGLAWSNNIKLEMMPTEVTYSSESGELTIKISSGAENKIVVIDKSGKQIQ